MNQPNVRNPRQEATALVPPGHAARVLEPSPPANLDPEWFADDPTAPETTDDDLVTPIANEGITWAELAATDPAVAEYAHKHWLDGTRRLAPLPGGYETTRRSLHQVAFSAVAPKRFSVNSKLGLRYTHDGFGTPFFRDGAHDEQVRVEGDLLVHQVGDSIRAQTITTLRSATEFLGIDFRPVWFEDFHDPLKTVDPDQALQVDGEATRALGSWFAFSTLILERLRRTPGAVDVSRVQLWPEHMDPAVELGSAERGERASYGASPGDEAQPKPYLYVAPWDMPKKSDPFWNAGSFSGAILGYDQLLEADDPYETALAFFQTGHRILHSKG